MPSTPVTAFIGKGLYAKKNIDKLDLSRKKIGQFKSGDFVGNIYSWIERDGAIYWLFKPIYGNDYLVKHDPYGFKLTNEIRDAIEIEDAKREKEKQDLLKQEKGSISYYIEKYGIWVLGAVLASVALKEYIKK